MNEESLEENNMDDTRSVQIIIFFDNKKIFLPGYRWLYTDSQKG
jgi:hypothetical protein